MGKQSEKRISKFLNSSALSRPIIMLGAASALLGAGPAQALDPGALPQDPVVTGGKSTFSQSGNTLNVNQSTNRTVIDWRSFDIGSQAQTNFNQPNSSSIAVNRVNGSANASQIEGGLHANGQVWILNPNGVFFGKNARVDAAGIVASTANIDDKAFMSGSNKLQMTGADHGSVVNEGNITVGKAGLAAFVAPSVRNSGTINATVGKVALAAGTTYTLDLAGDHLVELGLGSVNAVVDQSGKIVNPGGTIALTAKAASQVVNSVVNVSGIVDASSATKDGGDIVLGGDNINTTATASLKANAGTNGNGGSISMVATNQGNYDGSFSARGGSQSGNGGKIETSGKNVTVASTAKVDASAYNGIAGSWLLDPVDLSIISGTDNGVETGSSVTNGTIQDALNGGTDLTLSTSSGSGGSGDISLQTSINASGSGSLTLTGRHLSAANTSDVVNIAGGLTLNVNSVNQTATPGGSWINDAIKMIGTVGDGTTINLGNGTYTIAAGGTNYVFVNKSNVTINGQSEAGTIIDASGASTYGMRVWGDNVSLNDFTLLGVTATGGYGFKVEPVEPEAMSARINDFSISNVTEKGSAKNGLDLNGVVTATIDGVNISNTTAGTGIAITDSANVLVEHSETTNNAWGGIALYQHNAASNQQLTNVTIDGTNTINEVNGIYAEDESASLNFGTIDVSGLGFDYVGKAHAGTNDDYTFFQTSLQNATDLAALKSAPASLSAATVQGYSGTNLDGNNTFYVNQITGGGALSIQGAVNAATNGATINVGSGTFTGQVIVDNKSLTISGDGAGNTVIASPDTLTSYTPTGTSSAKTAIVSIQDGADVTVEDLTVDGLGKGNGRSSFDGIGVFNASADIDAVDITRVRDGGVGGTLSGAQHGIGVDVFNGDGAARTVSLLNSTIEDFQKNATAFDGGNLTVDVEGNTITGAGATSAIAQNGIQLFGVSGVGNGAVTGTIANNLVKDIDYAPGTYSAASILLINAPNTTVTNNTAIGEGKDTGSAGIYLIDSDGVTLTGNTVKNVGYGITLYGSTGATITNGSVLGTIAGLYADSASTGMTATGVAFSDNTYHFQGSSSQAAQVLANNTFDASVINANAGDTIYGKLQTAIDDTAAGSTLDLNGTFEEQVSLNKDMTLVGSGQGTTTIEAPDALSNSFTTQVGFAPGTNVKAVVGVTGGANVKIEDLTVDGGDKGDANDYFVGIGVDNSTVTVDGVRVTGINSDPLNGVQSGVGIGVFNEDGTARMATITNSTIDDFQKNGIALQGGNLTVDVEGNTVTGAGATSQIAQNGIELFGLTGIGNATVTGTIADNIVSGFDYTGGNNTAAGILLWNAANVAVTGNTVTGVRDSGSQGIYAVYSSGATFTGNTITNAGYGIGVYGSTGVTISGGTISHNLVGVEADSGSTGLNVSGVSFSNNDTHFEGPNADLAGVFNNNTFDAAAYDSNGDAITSDLQGIINGATAGDTIHAKGTFDQNVTDGTQLTFNFGDTTVDSFALTAGAAGSSVSGDLTATGAISSAGAVSMSGTFSAASIALNGATTLSDDTTLDANTVTVASVIGGGNDLTIDGTTSLGNVAGVGSLEVDGSATLTGTSYAASSMDFGAVTLGNDATLAANTVTVASVTGAGNDLTIDGTTSLGNVAGVGALAVDGSATLTGTSYAAGSLDFDAVALSGDTTLNANTVTVASVTGAGNDLTINGTTSLGNVAGVGALAVDGSATLTGTSYAANSLNFGAVTLGNDATLDANIVTVASVTGGGNDLTIDGTTSLGNVAGVGALAVDGSAVLAGNSYVANSITFGGALTLTGNTVLNTSADNGAITLASVDGATTGGQSLNINAGSGDVSVGNLGATTRLGAVTDASNTTLKGSVYNANSFVFGGDVTLTAATTTLNTSVSAGDITFTGNVFGTSDGAQSLVLNAGPGTGSASANGDIVLQNVGTTAIELGNLTVSGNDFTALTVDLAGNFSSQLTGNQVFAADTLNAGGNVTSNVAGDASGHVVAGGDVTYNVGGDVSGNVSGDNIDVNAGTVTGATLTGSTSVSVDATTVGGGTTITAPTVTGNANTFDATVTASNGATIQANTITGSYNGGAIDLTATKNIDVNVAANTLVVSAPRGSVDGTWTSIETSTTVDGSGSGGLDVNGQQTLGNDGANPNQLIVEGFPLPAGSVVTASGQIILPAGMVIGLLSPGGGEPKVILVESVQELGQLLASGYSAIVIDLSGHKKAKEKKQVKLASR